MGRFGQIPPYGKNFKHGRIGGWHPTMSDTIYILKRDEEWFIRPDRGSKVWRVFHGYARNTATQHGKSQPNMRGAMKLLLDGIAGGFYIVGNENVHAPNCCLLGSGLDKHCTCHVDYLAAQS